MRRNLSVLLTMVMILSMIFTGALAAEVGVYEGTWYLNTLQMEGIEMSAAMMGIEMEITLEAGGSALVRMTDEEDSVGAWVEIDGGVSLEIDGQTNDFFLDGDMLVAEDAGMLMIFGKDSSSGEGFAPAAVRVDAQFGEFDGDWIATLVETMGVAIPISLTGIEITLAVDGANATITYLEADAPDVLALSLDAFEGGVLTMKASDEDAADERMAFQLHEDGLLSLVTEDATIYFERAVEDVTTTDEVPATDDEPAADDEPEVMDEPAG
ncbi:MAG: hypothetical protein ACOYI5_00790 [Christensenellales bacterium]|jgi:hypothetical protein